MNAKDLQKLIDWLIDGARSSVSSPQMVADMLTMHEHSYKHPTEIAYCYLGDARNNTARSLLVTGAMLGMDVRIAAPRSLWPDEQLRERAAGIASTTGARITISEHVDETVVGVDFLYTDVWVSMGEPATTWDERIELLLPYQVNASVVRLDSGRRLRRRDKAIVRIAD